MSKTGSILPSIDYSPPTPATVQAAEEAAAGQGDFDGVVYWTQYGRSYHLDTECRTLANSEILFEGDMDGAFEANRKDPCDICAGGGLYKEDGFDEFNQEGAVDGTLEAPLEEESPDAEPIEELS